MALLWVLLAVLQGCPTLLEAAHTGVCPTGPRASTAGPEPTTKLPPTSGVHYVGTVRLLVSLSDTGYVCDVQVLKGIDNTLNKQAVEALKQEIFQPIRQDGKPIPGSMTVWRQFWRGDKDDFLMSVNADATPDEITNDARTFRPLDVRSVFKSGTIEDEKYQNQYFGLSFVAPHAVFRTPPPGDDEGMSVRLVDASVSGPKREDMYTISVLADRLSNYPALKSRAEYLDGMSAQLIHSGAKPGHSDFPYLISDLEFIGSILRESDGPGVFHFRGLFSAIIKGYVLTLDVAAPTEESVLRAVSLIKIDSRQ